MDNDPTVLVPVAFDGKTRSPTEILNPFSRWGASDTALLISSSLFYLSQTVCLNPGPQEAQMKSFLISPKRIPLPPSTPLRHWQAALSGAEQCRIAVCLS